MLFLIAALTLATADPATADRPVKQAQAESAGDISGASVRVACIAKATGFLDQCVVLEETRPGFGFGEAAVALMTGEAVTPATENGKPIDSRFERTIQFTP